MTGGNRQPDEGRNEKRANLAIATNVRGRGIGPAGESPSPVESGPDLGELLFFY